MTMPRTPQDVLDRIRLVPGLCSTKHAEISDAAFVAHIREGCEDDTTILVPRPDVWRTINHFRQYDARGENPHVLITQKNAIEMLDSLLGRQIDAQTISNIQW